MKIETHHIQLAGVDALTLDAATETDVLIDTAGTPTVGIDTSSTDVVSVVLKNTGAADIETVTSYVSPLGTEFVAFAANHGPVTSGDSVLLTFEDIEGNRFRLTCTSTAGTDVEVEAVGFRRGR